MWVSAVRATHAADENMIMNPDQNQHATRPSSQPAHLAVDGLHVCVLCAGRLVHPYDWEAEGPHHWRVFLRCPDCEAIREGLFTQQAVDRLADELDRGSGELIKALEELTRENMTAEADVLIRALQEDLILPSDF
jgi:hypothetical protein